MLLLHRPSTEELDLLLAASEDAELTYTAVGATREAQLPAGYTHDRYSLAIGPGASFEKATEGLRRWKAHQGAGVRMAPDEAVAEGATHIAIMHFGFSYTLAPVRVVYVIDQPERYGWAYGTLPGHPEEGEELFEVRRTDEGTEFQITAFSRPAELLARLAAPITRQVQRSVTRGYLKALKTYTEMG